MAPHYERTTPDIDDAPSSPPVPTRPFLSPPPPPSEGSRDVFGHAQGGGAQKRNVLRLFGEKEERERERELHPYEIAARDMDSADRRLGLLRVTPRPPHESDSEKPEIEVLLLLSPAPESLEEQEVVEQICRLFMTDHPEFEHVHLYAHYRACAAALGEDEGVARKAVEPVDFYALRQNLAAGTAVSSLLGVRVLRKLIDRAVQKSGKRSFLVSGLADGDRDAVAMFAREVSIPFWTAYRSQ